MSPHPPTPAPLTLSSPCPPCRPGPQVPTSPQLGNVVVQCPTCRSWDVNKLWNYAIAYYQCARCGFLWS